MLAAAPATRPSTSPTSKPAKTVPLDSVVKKLPKSLRPPSGEWTSAEIDAAAKWFEAELRDQRVTFTSAEFTYTGGGDRRTADLESNKFSIAGHDWLFRFEANLTEAGNKSASKLRDVERLKVSGKFDVFVGTTNGGSGIVVRATLKDVDLSR